MRVLLLQTNKFVCCNNTPLAAHPPPWGNNSLSLKGGSWKGILSIYIGGKGAHPHSHPFTSIGTVRGDSCRYHRRGSHQRGQLPPNRVEQTQRKTFSVCRWRSPLTTWQVTYPAGFTPPYRPRVWVVVPHLVHKMSPSANVCLETACL